MIQNSLSFVVKIFVNHFVFNITSSFCVNQNNYICLLIDLLIDVFLGQCVFLK